MVKHNIVFVHQDAYITGSAISLRNLIDGLDKDIFKIFVVAPIDGPAVNIWKEVGATVQICFFYTFWTSPGPKCIGRSNIKQYRSLLPNRKLRQTIKGLNPSLVHINDKAALQAGISLLNSGIPVIQHSRSAFHNTKCKINKFVSSKIIPLYSDEIIAISEDEIQGFEKSKNLSVIYNTVNFSEVDTAINESERLRNDLQISGDEIVIGMAENMSIHKGLLDIISIIDNFTSEQLQKVKFLLVGKFSEIDNLSSIGVNKSSKEYILEFIEKNNLQDKVILTGFQPKPLPYIAAMDIILVSKSHGVLGRQPIEAQALGTMVLAINGHSKKSTLVQNSKGGYLMNSIEELTEKLLQLITNKDKIKEHGEMGREYAKLNFDMMDYAKKITNIYLKYIN